MEKYIAYRAYATPVLLFLHEHGATTPGHLSYHIGCREQDLNFCLSMLHESGQIERVGTETQSRVYGGQILYQVKKSSHWQERALIELSLDHACEEVRDLRRYEALTSEQYDDILGLLTMTRMRLRGYLDGKEYLDAEEGKRA